MVWNSLLLTNQLNLSYLTLYKFEFSLNSKPYFVLVVIKFLVPLSHVSNAKYCQFQIAFGQSQINFLNCILVFCGRLQQKHEKKYAVAK